MYTEDIAKFIDSKSLPSADVVIYHEHNEIYRYTCGYKDSAKTVPLKGDELYYLYSATKPITCTAAMQLVEKGEISLEDPVYKFIPEYKNLTYIDNGEIKPCKNVMTIRHLFAMRGGLDYNLNRPAKVELLKENPKASTLEIVKSFVRDPLSFEPGTRYQYSLCHDVLAAVIEVVSGMSFGEYLKKNIFEPLGMTRTTFNVTEDMIPQFAAQYRYENDNYIEIPIHCVYKLGENYESGGAGLASCVDDYIKFADAMANGGLAANGNRILRPETVDLMRVNQSEIDPDNPGNVRPGINYALGVRTMVDKKLAGANVPSEFEFGWDGAAGTYVSMDARNKITTVYFQHVLGHGWIYTDVHPVLRDTAYKIAGIV